MVNTMQMSLEKMFSNFRRITMRCDHKKEDSWWVHDGQGIPLARVCDKCIDEVLSKYNPVVLGHYTQADIDEPIEEDY
jgi:hypothetical protein